MNPWPRYPVVYEINTWAWLAELSAGRDKPVDLASVPKAVWDRIAAAGFDAVWLMGVWERSPAGIAIAMQNPGLLEDFRRALADFTSADNVGSPYCVRRYVVDSRLGGPAGLKVARERLRERGLRLILDFVPNHVAPDYPWVASHPEYFIQGSRADLESQPAAFIEAGGKVFACGRDPFFPAWPDVLQLDASNPDLRNAVIETIEVIAEQCDGIRCDMAMLVMNAIFERTWGERAGPLPQADYWPAVIARINADWPSFTFIAEAYWDKEWELQQQGFDFCYDKQLYDRMEHGDAPSLRRHLLADMAYQDRMVRFIENHDEPRAAATFSPEKARAAAVVFLTLPGMRLVHEGQIEGRRTRLPVFLGRRPEEPVDEDLVAFYGRLLAAVDRSDLNSGNWRLCECDGWPDNQSCRNLLAWCWAYGQQRSLVVVNYGGAPAQGKVRLPFDGLGGKTRRLTDLATGEVYERGGDAMRDDGLYVDLAPWRFHLLDIAAA